MWRRSTLESSFNNYFTDVLLSYTNADAAISPGFRYEVPLVPAGWDLGNGVTATGNYFPAPYTFGVGTAEAGHIKGIVEDLMTLVFSPDV